MIALSNDGYIRLISHYFAQVRLSHLHSNVDSDKPPLEGEGALLSSITGYTEWISETQPTITIGWDWQIAAPPVGQIYFTPLGYPRSNLMFVDGRGNDLGHFATEIWLQSWVKSFEWQPSVHKALHLLS